MQTIKGKEVVLKTGNPTEYQDAPMPEYLRDILLRRGITDLGVYLHPTLKNSMPHPFTLKGMEDAVRRIVSAYQKGERIAFYGDYDVDGGTSTAILTRYFKLLNYDNTTFYIPQRLTEGYGPNAAAMEHLRKVENVDVVMVVDSGTTAYAPLNAAKELGMDIVVLDHHKPDGALNDDGTPKVIPGIVVNPKRFDEDGQYDYLCTAGLAFWFIVGMNRVLRDEYGVNVPDIRHLLGLVALGTVCDMVPLKGLNRAYVSLGLPYIVHNLGLSKLVEVTACKEVNEGACGFMLGPCINAGGRIDNTMLGARLMTTDDEAEATELANLLFELNKERRAIQDKAVEEAMEMVNANPDEPMYVLYSEDWHPGIVGLVASRVKEATEKSVIAIGTKGKGSARSVDGFDIGQAIIDAKNAGMLITGGGHMAAGGLTIDPARLDEFRAYIYTKSNAAEVKRTMHVDMICELDKFDPGYLNDFPLIAPIGMGNPGVRILFTGAMVVRVSRFGKDKNFDKHIKMKLMKNGEEAEAIAWGAADTILGDAMESAVGREVAIVASASNDKVKLDFYRGYAKLQMIVEDLCIIN